MLPDVEVPMKIALHPSLRSEAVNRPRCFLGARLGPETPQRGFAEAMLPITWSKNNKTAPSSLTS